MATIYSAAMPRDANGAVIDSVGFYAMRVIIVGGDTTYICRAAPGSASSAAVWQISRTVVSGSTTIITWADGNTHFDNVADDYATLSYS